MQQTLDERTLKELFYSHFKGLVRFAAGYVKDEEMAREIVQDAFVSLWMKRDSIDIARQVKSYLTTAVRNKCLNHLRDNQKFSSEILAIENLSENMAYHQHDPMEERELTMAIETAIEELPEKCREVFRLNRFEQLKYQEIATRLGISVKTVETQMSKALQHLRLRLSKYILAALLSVTCRYIFYVMASGCCQANV